MFAIDGIYPNIVGLKWIKATLLIFVVSVLPHMTHGIIYALCMNTLEIRRNHGKSFEAADHLCTVKVSQPLLV